MLRLTLGSLLLLATACAPSPEPLTGLSTTPPLSTSARSLLEDLIAIPSGTANVAGQDAMRLRLVPEFEDLGFSATTHVLANERKLIELTVPTATPDVLFAGHLDTVFNTLATPTLVERDDGRLAGPGVIDMKGGLVVMLETLRVLTPAQRARVRVLLNDDEEVGSTSSRDKLKELATGANAGLIFEPGLPGGTVVTAHSGVRWLELSVVGRSAHAGLEPQNGLNACIELSHKIVAISQLSDFSRQLYVNPGVIQGGTAPNVICEKASVKIDIRYVRDADLEEALASIEGIRATSNIDNPAIGLETTATLQQLAAMPSMPFSATTRLFNQAKEAASALGQVPLEGAPVGYASDGNHLATLGIDLLVGVGPHGGKMHTAEEFLTTASINERIDLNAELVRRIISNQEGL
jgi:glutamate carboxypeptidase